jgi:hypothetical protein
MQPTHSFEPKVLSLLGSIIGEIEAEFEALGLPLDETTRELIAHKLIGAASRGIVGHDELKSCALAGP